MIVSYLQRVIEIHPLYAPNTMFRLSKPLICGRKAASWGGLLSCRTVTGLDPIKPSQATPRPISQFKARVTSVPLQIIQPDALISFFFNFLFTFT
jgi:hypothetical protein